MIPEHKSRHWIYSKRNSSSLLQKYSKAIPKLVLAEVHHLRNLFSFTRPACQIILFALSRNCKDTWPNGYKYPVHAHDIHSRPTNYPLISTKRNSFQPPPQILTSVTWIFSYQSSASKTQIITINLHPPEKLEHEFFLQLQWWYQWVFPFSH